MNGATSGSQTFTLGNSGNGSLPVSAITLTGGDNAMFSLTTGDGTGGTCGATPTIAVGGSCTVSASFSPASAGGKSATLSVTSNDPVTPNQAIALTGTGVQKSTQSIVITTGAPATAAYGATFTVAAYATSALPVTYSSGSPTICTNAGATFTMVNSSGACKVQYDQGGNASFVAATQVVETVTAQQTTQATLLVTGPTVMTYGDADATISTSGGNGTGAVNFDVTGSTACIIVSGKLHSTSGTGTCAITATKAADSNYTLATSSAATVTINKASQSAIAVTAPGSVTYGSSANVASSGGDGTGAILDLDG